MSFLGAVFCKFFWRCFVSSLGATSFPPRGSIGLGLTNSLVTPFLDLKSMMLPFLSRGHSSEDSRRAPEQQPRSQGQEIVKYFLESQALLIDPALPPALKYLLIQNF